MTSLGQERMRGVVVDHFGGPEVLEVVEEDGPRPRPRDVLVRVLAAGGSRIRSCAGTCLGVPKPPFTPGYELVGVVEELGAGCTPRQRMQRASIVGRVRERAVDESDDRRAYAGTSGSSPRAATASSTPSS